MKASDEEYENFLNNVRMIKDHGPKIAAILLKVLNKDPEQRPSFKELKRLLQDDDEINRELRNILKYVR